MEENPNQRKFKSREEYEEEFNQSGEKFFSNFLFDKMDEARASGDEELFDYIENIVIEEKNERLEKARKYEPDYEGGFYSSRYYKSLLEELGLQELKAEYEAKLVMKEKSESELKYIKQDLQYGDLLSREINELNLRINYIEDELWELNVDMRILRNKIKLDELKLGITQMSPEEIVEEYKKQLSQIQADMARRKYHAYFNPTDIEFINETIQLIETHSSMRPELEPLIAEQKEQKDRIEQGEQEDLSVLPLEELLEIIDRNKRIITCNEHLIKQALAQKILGQQQQIAEQEFEISRLQGQKEL